ncbi:MAG: hypothetical protein M1827_002558 [Pycnora praestabilis]|nr:MAG: hypothetical protein M1827_002558 [Pycnora praestabilis]
MALDEATTSDSFPSDSSPTSDTDPYSSSPQTDMNDIDIRSLPGPLPILGPIWGYSQQYMVSSIHRRILGASSILGRPVNKDEATALAFYTAKSLSIASWGNPLGTMGGWYQAYQTAGKYRFPFVTPPETFNPNQFTKLVQGRNAQICWHLLRGSIYGSFGSIVGGLLITTYAATVAAVGEQQDPRLKEMINALKLKAREMGKNGLPARQTVGQRRDPTGQGETSTSDLWKNHRQTMGDDASPLGGSDGDVLNQDNRKLGPRGDGMLSDSQIKTQEVQQQPRPERNPTPDRTSTFSMDKVATQPRTFDEDDASPTTGSGSMDAGSSGGSAWERIRREASGSSTPVGRGSSRPGNRMRGTEQDQGEAPTSSDSFSFSDSEEDRRLVREEAQRKFDERVERERRGGNF